MRQTQDIGFRHAVGFLTSFGNSATGRTVESACDSGLRMIHPIVMATALLAAASSGLAGQLKTDLQNYLAANGKTEHVSAASLSVNFGDGTIVDVAAGTTSYGGSTPVTTANLFQIGSNTKAFTSVAFMHLQRSGKVKLDQTIGDWLPQYPAWKTVTFRHILSMTSGIATYDDTQSWERDFSSAPLRDFTPAELIGYIYPKPPRVPPGWLYSNTGYILTELVIEKASGQSYTDFLRRSVIAPTGIADLYYYPNIYPAALRARTVSGYFFNDSPDNAGLAPILGRDVRDDSLSWAQSAGAIVGSPHAVGLWARDLYRGTILTASERTDMETLVSSETGLPIPDISTSEPRGFGLGISKMMMPGLGAFYFYEGMTLGYRMVHAYFPAQNLVLAVGLNSQPPDGKDHVGALMQALAKTLKANGKF